GPRHAPLVVANLEHRLPDLESPLGGDPAGRLGLIEQMDREFARDHGAPSARAHATYLQGAVRLMHSARARAFERDREPAALRDAYGRNPFGQGCLLARRLVGAGVPFVGVALDGWDTHDNTAQRIRNLSAQLDPAMATLVRDLKQRGLLESTLVIWMGEFGRDPRRGSDHHPRAWTTVLAGAGLRGGIAVGN